VSDGVNILFHFNIVL